jgi:hypothetical protein
MEQPSPLFFQTFICVAASEEVKVMGRKEAAEAEVKKLAEARAAMARAKERAEAKKVAKKLARKLAHARILAETRVAMMKAAERTQFRKLTEEKMEAATILVRFSKAERIIQTRGTNRVRRATISVRTTTRRTTAASIY